MSREGCGQWFDGVWIFVAIFYLVVVDMVSMLE